MVLLTWYNSVVLSGGGSLESSSTTGELPGCGIAGLSKGPVGPLERNDI